MERGKLNGKQQGAPVAVRQRNRAYQALAAFVASRAFVPVAVVCSVFFLVVIYAQLAGRLGWPALSASPQSPHSVQITGPNGTGAVPSIQAYVLGAVAQPGVYALGADARINDLIQAAGGFLPDADLARVHLAVHVTDGQQVYVPRVGEVVQNAAGSLVNLNSASAQQLHDALGISLPIAQRIVAYRDAHGPFTAVSQLLLVPVSRSTYDRVKYLVTL